MTTIFHWWLIPALLDAIGIALLIWASRSNSWNPVAAFLQLVCSAACIFVAIAFCVIHWVWGACNV